MPYDEEMANRVREVLGAEKGLTEKPMFGGLGFLLRGNLAVSVSRQGGLLVRVEPSETEALLRRKGASPFVTRGRAMDGWLRVDSQALRTSRQLRQWVDTGVARARALAPK